MLTMKTGMRVLATLGIGAGFAGIGAGPDVTFCELFGLRQFGREGSIVGMAGATTSWNLGTTQLIWLQGPDSRHPFITQNVYRIDPNGRFLHIGQSWCKNGFFALSNTQCGGTCNATNGTRLGIGCTDTYGSNLNAQQTGTHGNSPRYETDPWTGAWDFGQSTFAVGGVTDTTITRRLQLEDDDLDAALNPGATWYFESYYVHRDDTDHMNSASWKDCTFNLIGDTWWPTMSGPATIPNEGFAIDAWTGSTQTIMAQEVPVVENVSPDGRCVLAAQAFDEGGGNWRYEYVVLNVDMARQASSLAIPVPSGANVSGIGMHAARHHNEPVNDTEIGTPIDNAAWSGSRVGDQVVWSTSTNPVRWGTAYTFWFTCDVAPGTGCAVLGHFNPGLPTHVTGSTVAPAGVVEGASMQWLNAPTLATDVATTVTVDVDPGAATISGVTLHHDVAGSVGTTAMSNAGGMTWEGDLPVPQCGDSVDYSVEVVLSDGTSLRLPDSDISVVGEGAELIVFADDFETDLGWSVDFDGTDTATSGAWDRGDPAITDAQADFDKSPVGTQCFATGLPAGGSNHSFDVDGGVTTLTSPLFDLSGTDSARIEYWRWFNNSRGGAAGTDPFDVEISDDDGATWSTVESFGIGGKHRYGDWFHHSFDVASTGAGLTSQMRLRFSARDDGIDSLVEAAIDEVVVTSRTCASAVGCDGDVDGNGVVDVADVGYVIFRLGNSGAPGGVDGDADGNGVVDVNDIGYVIFRFGAC